MDRFSCVRILDGCVSCILSLNKVWNSHSHFFFLSIVMFAVYAIQYNNIIMQYDFFECS